MRSLYVVLVLVSAACMNSHPGSVVEIANDACVTCHQDEYDATSMPTHTTVAPTPFPTSCADCHRTSSWQPALGGLHPAPPKFPIASGPHRGIKCLDCHNLDIMAPSTLGANTDCVACHPDSSELRSDHQGASGPQGEPYAYTPDVRNFCLTCHPTGTAYKHKFPRRHHGANACTDCHDRSTGPDAGGQNVTCFKSGCHSLGEEDRRHDGGSYTRAKDGTNHFCLKCHADGRGDD
jgi:hypothetical protein